MVTVGDVLREVLPPGTVCLAGRTALTRPTSWAVMLHLRGGLSDLGPGALALINLELLRQLPARPSLPQAIDILGRLGVAAIAVRGRLEPRELPIAGRLADRMSYVLLQLPDTKEGAVERVADRVNSYLVGGPATMRNSIGRGPSFG